MRYIHYDVQDFVDDLEFRKWVLGKDTDANFFWEKWILNNPEKRETIERARVMLLAFQFEEQTFSESDKQRLLVKIDTAIASKEENRDVKVLPLHDLEQSYLNKYQIKPVTNSRWWLRTAVVLIGIMLSSLLLTQIVSNREVHEDKIVFIQKENAVGRQTVLLPDGSSVVLNAKSKLVFPAEFSNDVREVILSGEAFFEVVKDTTKPFIVEANGLKTHVLGTSFNIKAYPNASNSTVALVSGKVWVETNTGKEQSMVLLPGEAADFDLEKDEIIKDQFNYMEEIAWKDGTLYLSNTPLLEVFDRLELWYGVAFQYSSLPQKAKSVSGSFKNESLANVLQSISYTVNFDYIIENENVLVKFK